MLAVTCHEVGEDSLDSLTDLYNNVIGRQIGEAVIDELIRRHPDEVVVNTSHGSRYIVNFEKFEQEALDLVKEKSTQAIIKESAIIKWDDARLTKMPGYRPGLPKETGASYDIRPDFPD
jgi:hypothetical protein